MLRTYNSHVINQARQKTLRAYRIVTEWLHGICQLDRKQYTESQELITIAQLYSVSFAHSVLYVYHGWLYRSYPIFEAYFYLHARTFIHTVLHQRMGEWLQQLMWQYETDDKQLITDILILTFVRKRLYGKPYVDPEPVLKYVLDIRKEKERQQFQKRIQLWNKHKDKIIRLYKQANPFLSEDDIWFIFLQTDVTVWQRLFSQKPQVKGRKQKQNIDRSNLNQLSITPEYVAHVLKVWWNRENTKHQSSQKRLQQKPATVKSLWQVTLENPFGLE